MFSIQQTRRQVCQWRQINVSMSWSSEHQFACFVRRSMQFLKGKVLILKSTLRQWIGYTQERQVVCMNFLCEIQADSLGKLLLFKSEISEKPFCKEKTVALIYLKSETSSKVDKSFQNRSLIWNHLHFSADEIWKTIAILCLIPNLQYFIELFEIVNCPCINDCFKLVLPPSFPDNHLCTDNLLFQTTQ